MFKFEGDLYPTEKTADVGEKSDAEKEDDAKKQKLEGDGTIPKFRCTCYRSGSGHSFSSMDAARSIGGAIQDKFQWKVQMKGFDIEVVVNIDKGIRLQQEFK